MRDLKFRAWDIKEKRMFLVSSIDLGATGTMYGVVDDRMTFRVPEDIILMQYSGFLDRRKQEIYEGDIFKFAEPIQNTMGYNEVYFNEYTGCWSWIAWNRSCTPFYTSCVHGSTDGGGVDCSELMKTEEEIEIIGNIHENPKLLEND